MMRLFKNRNIWRYTSKHLGVRYTRQERFLPSMYLYLRNIYGGQDSILPFPRHTIISANNHWVQILLISVFFLFNLNAATIELSIDRYIKLSSQNDTVFEEILLNRLPLQYQKALRLPPGDIILGVKEQYNFNFSSESTRAERSISLSKLFPFSGTELSASYQKRPSFTSIAVSELAFTLAQPIAENAFGKNTRIRDKIIGIETEIAHHQITEAYEDYLAIQLVNYYDWHAAYKNLMISESSYQQNVKLLDNINARQSSKIALPIDVNKITIQVINKKEQLIRQREAYNRQYNLIKTSMRYKGEDELIPVAPEIYAEIPSSFETAFNQFKESGRTYKVLDLLTKNSQLNVEENADDLLPSIDILLGFSIRGRNSDLSNSDQLGFAGVSLEWPFSDQREEAEHQIAEIEEQQTKLNVSNVHYELFTNLQNLLLAINRENELVKSAEEKIKLSEEILKDETENYSYGKVTLNDYIRAVNVLDSNRFNQVDRRSRLRELIVEWMRLTDQLLEKAPDEK